MWQSKSSKMLAVDPGGEFMSVHYKILSTLLYIKILQYNVEKSYYHYKIHSSPPLSTEETIQEPPVDA